MLLLFLFFHGTYRDDKFLVAYLGFIVVKTRAMDAESNEYELPSVKVFIALSLYCGPIFQRKAS